MHRIDHATAVASPPTPAAPGTPGYFTKGNPAGGQAATVLTDDWANDVQENMLEVCTRAGVTPTKGDKDDLADAIGALINTNLSIGFLSAGPFEYVGATSVRLALGPRSLILCEIDRTILSSASAITWDITSGGILESGSEASSTWYYCYLVNVGGVATPRISTTAPHWFSGAKIGYHPTLTGWRYVGAFYNDASSNVKPFYCPERGVFVFRTLHTVYSPGTTVFNTYQSQSLASALPAVARGALIETDVTGDSIDLFVGHESLVGTAVSSNDTHHHHKLLNLNGGTITVSSWQVVDATPAVAWGYNGGANVTTFGIGVKGWRD